MEWLAGFFLVIVTVLVALALHVCQKRGRGTCPACGHQGASKRSACISPHTIKCPHCHHTWTK